jgi:hypothetical protein
MKRSGTEPILGANQEFHVGTPTVIEAPSPEGQFGVVFEDDGTTGYFYALDSECGEEPFVDALHIYSVEGVTDRHFPSFVHILWSSDGSKACLIINRYPHAMFDFSNKKSYSRDVFPEPAPRSQWTHHAWDDSLRGCFFHINDRNA